jgi:hypothetical protein
MIGAGVYGKSKHGEESILESPAPFSHQWWARVLSKTILYGETLETPGRGFFALVQEPMSRPSFHPPF